MGSKQKITVYIAQKFKENVILNVSFEFLITSSITVCLLSVIACFPDPSLVRRNGQLSRPAIHNAHSRSNPPFQPQSPPPPGGAAIAF